MQVCSINNSNTNFKAFVPTELSDRLIIDARNMGVLPIYMEQVKSMEQFGNLKSYFSVIKGEGLQSDTLALSNPYSYSIIDGKLESTKAKLDSTGKTLIEQFLSVTEKMINLAQKELDNFLH